MAGSHQPTCGLLPVLVFLGALVAGTCCSLSSKILLSMQSIGITGEVENFSYPLFQTLGMFVGMTCGLVVHFFVVTYKIPFPGYVHQTDSGDFVNMDGKVVEEPKAIPTWMYYLLIIPSIFDLVATALAMFGLRYVDVSMYQMLRGGAIVFVAFLKHFAIGHQLRKFQWIGVFWNVMSIVIVGCTAMLNAPTTANGSSESAAIGPQNHYNQPMTGVMLILLGAFVQSLQYAFEEKVMNMDIPAPPMLLIGMEGLWGTLLCVCVLYPLAYHIPGPDHGCIENPYNTLAMISNSTSIQKMFCLYFLSVFLYNVFGVLVTCVLNSVWHAILDNFRPISVWGTDLYIFYMINRAFGEAWTLWSYLELLGMVVLLYGTAIYNAPNQGSIKLLGEWYSFGLDFRDEYEEIEEDIEVSGYVPGPESFKSPLLTPKSNKGTPRTRNGQYEGILMTPDYGSRQITSIQKGRKQTSFRE